MKKEGSSYTGDTTLYPLLDNEGNCQYILAIVRDITEKQLLEDTLYETQRLFQIITDNSLDVIRILDPSGIIRYSSPSSEWIVGFKPEHYIGNHFTKFLDPKDRDRVEKRFVQLLEEKNQFVSS